MWRYLWSWSVILIPIVLVAIDPNRPPSAERWAQIVHALCGRQIIVVRGGGS